MGYEHVIFVLAILFFIYLVVIWSLHVISLIYGKYKFHKKPKTKIEQEKLPGVSIIKPLMGADENLKENLETFFVMDYPTFELLFCVQDVNDPAINVVKNLIEQYPNIDAKLFCGGKVVGINPKINNMEQGYQVAKYELMLISDAGLRMANDTLYDMVSLMTEKVGLVHQMPFTTDRPGFSGALEKVYFGTCHCRMYLFINLIGINCVTGMSCLMRKTVLDQLGGLQKFGNYIAEDYFLAQAFLDNKWIIQLSHQPAMQNAASYSVPTWQKRMIRWCKLRLKLNIMSWLEPMQECFLSGLCTCWTVNVLFGWNSLVFFLFHVLCWLICDYTLLKIAQNGKLPFSKLDYVLSWLYRESICYYLFLKAASNPTVRWRDGKYRLKWGGLAEEIVDDTKPSVPKSTGTSSTLILSNKSINNKIKKPTTNHKRTSSYSVTMKNSPSLNSNSYNSDVESSTSIPLLSQISPTHSNNQLNLNLLSTSSNSRLNRGLHQHHHSISNPITHPNSYPSSPVVDPKDQKSTSILLDMNEQDTKLN